MNKDYYFLKCQMSRSKGLVPTKISFYMKYSCEYENSGTRCCKVFGKVKVFKK